MRALHPAEARVTEALLAGDSASGLIDGLPRRTRQTVLRRIEAWGWLVDRWVPHVACVEVPRLVFVVARAYAERSRELERLWKGSPATLHAWTSAGSLLGVFADASGSEAPALTRRLVPDSLGRAELCLSTDIGSREVLAYFDFEGAWVRLAHLDGVRAYPRGVWPAEGSTDPSTPEDGPSELVFRSVELLLRQQPEGRDPPVGGTFTDGTRGDSQVERALREGWVQRRRFLDPSAVARVVTNFPAQAAMVWGAPAPGAALGDLLPELVAQVRAAPFLFVATPSGVLAGFLSRPPSEPEGSSRGMLPILRRYLVRIDSARLPIASLRTLVPHRFSALLGSRAAMAHSV